MSTYCDCFPPQPCWLNVQSATGVNPDGTTNGTGIGMTSTYLDLPLDTTKPYTGTPSDLVDTASLLNIVHKEGTQCTYTITFPAVVTENGLSTSYNIYGSPSPLSPQLLISGWIPTDGTATSHSLDYTVPIPFASTEIQWHFWVEGMPSSSGLGGLISTTGASVFTSSRDWTISASQQVTMPLSYPVDASGNVIDTEYLNFIIQKARTDKMVVLQSDGEPFDLYIRRWEGIPCPKSEVRSSSDVANPDLDYNSHTNCPYCLGTGFVGGYYPKIKIIARYNQNPARKLTYDSKGVQTQQALQSWTLWTPLLRSNDLVVQLSTGDRFYIQDVSRSMLRAYIMDQQYNNALVQRSEIAYEVTDAKIKAAFIKYKTDYADVTPAYPFEPTDPIWG